ncbi:efflux transporter outer membrane subunit [Stenoxybacter acetivorans]|uniref:efflux transporter outer membrane subunit n=1 Tax=Stenoxybacter acetivorans TaxID=422441 RepID=UPI00056D5CE6|nr:efflux transporter outer membrane subunit [Stenoxybacter acetivorans]
MIKNKMLLSVVAAAVLSACSMAPNYQQPTVELANHFPAVSGSRNQGNILADHLGWQDYFADERLRSLMALALQNNRDLRVAALNVEAVRAQYAIARANQLPALGVTGSAQKGRTAQDLSSRVDAQGQQVSFVSEAYNVGFGVTAFELDLFGRVNSLSKSALNRYFGQIQNRDAAQISLIASVADAYFAERVAQESMDLAQRVLQSREESKRLTDLSYKAGVISAIDVNIAETQIETARAGYASAQQARDQAQNAMALLIGQPIPAGLPPALPLNQQFAHVELPVGLPSDVLYRRPDVREAEFALKSANADIGAARAAFFPRINLIGSIGSGSTELNGLFDGVNRTWSFMPQITLPIFTWGQNKANLDLAEVRKNIAVAQYEKTVQAAFRDVADALVARSALRQQYQAQQKSTQAQLNRYRLVKMRYDHGISSSLELLDAERDSYSAQQALLQTQQMLLQNRADLYKALGGGLNEETQTAANETAAQ